MGDYRIEAKVRNARVLRALEGIGETASGFARKRGLNIGRMCEIAAMKRPPVNASGDWWPEVMELCDAAGVMPSDLFTQRQMQGVKNARSVQDVSEDELRYRLAETERLALDCRLPEDNVADIELAGNLLNSLKETHPRNARAVESHQDGGTFRDIGRELDVSVERARQIVFKGYRIMRERAEKRYGVREYG